MNKTLHYSVETSEMCIVLRVFEDGLVESNETLFLEVTTEDPAVMLVEPRIAVITIINSDSKCTRSV